MKCLESKDTACCIRNLTNRYVLPQIDSAVIRIAMTCEKAKVTLQKMACHHIQNELPRMEEKMERVTREVHEFVSQKLVEMEKRTVHQMITMEKDFKRALNGTLYPG